MNPEINPIYRNQTIIPILPFFNSPNEYVVKQDTKIRETGQNNKGEKYSYKKRFKC